MRRGQVDPGIGKDSVLVEGHWYEELVVSGILVETDVLTTGIVQEEGNAVVTEILLCFNDYQ